MIRSKNPQRIRTRIEGVSGTYTVSTTDLMLAEKPGAAHLTAKNGVLDIDIAVPIGGLMVLRKA
jgi:hypothetical protein